LEREARFFGRPSVVALLLEDTGRDTAGEARGVSGVAVMTTCFCGVVASGALALALFAASWFMANEGEGVCRRRTEPIMERGIWTRKEPLLVGEDGVCGDEYSWW
jgi:hypothetical protein